MVDIISCSNCTKPFEVHPPDNTHTKSSVEYVIGSTIQLHDCPFCKTSTKLHWSS